jgi:hypothetical protein
MSFRKEHVSHAYHLEFGAENKPSGSLSLAVSTPLLFTTLETALNYPQEDNLQFSVFLPPLLSPDH